MINHHCHFNLQSSQLWLSAWGNLLCGLCSLERGKQSGHSGWRSWGDLRHFTHHYHDQAHFCQSWWWSLWWSCALGRAQDHLYYCHEINITSSSMNMITMMITDHWSGALGGARDQLPILQLPLHSHQGRMHAFHMHTGDDHDYDQNNNHDCNYHDADHDNEIFPLTHPIPPVQVWVLHRLQPSVQARDKVRPGPWMCKTWPPCSPSKKLPLLPEVPTCFSIWPTHLHVDQTTYLPFHLPTYLPQGQGASRSSEAAEEEQCGVPDRPQRWWSFQSGVQVIIVSIGVMA